MQKSTMQCLDCIYYKTDCTCLAFPTGIPSEIIANEFNHHKSYPGDHGIRFKRRLPDLLWNFDPERQQINELNGFYFVVRVLQDEVALFLFQKQNFRTRLIQIIHEVPTQLLFRYSENQPGTYKINPEIRVWLENQFLPRSPLKNVIPVVNPLR